VRLHLLALSAVAAAAGVGASFVPAAEADRVVAYTGLRTPSTQGGSCPIPQRFRGEFEAASRDTGLPLSLLLAVATVESSLQENAVSPAGARGLLQVMPATAESLELDANDTPENVLAGARYLSLMFDRFRSAELALAAYNAGPTAVENAYGMPPTVARPYVEAVMALWKRYSGCV
jgi:soluble lytic murein transglycosylase-like protein